MNTTRFGTWSAIWVCNQKTIKSNGNVNIENSGKDICQKNYGLKQLQKEYIYIAYSIKK